MTKTARLVAYYAQNGSYRLTPRQRRRAEKKDATALQVEAYALAELAAAATQ
jgi:hypothetical protein